MADKKTCGEHTVEGSHVKECNDTGEFMCLIYWFSYEDKSLTYLAPRCGIHAKRYERIEEIK